MHESQDRTRKALQDRRAAHHASQREVARLPVKPAHIAVGFALCAVGVLLMMRMHEPVGVRADSWSEAEVIVSGWGYARSGFLAYAGLPQHQIGPPVDPYFLYANYPVLSNVIYGALHQLGADTGGFYRLPAILASLLAVWLWYRLVTRMVDAGTGVAAALALATSFGFLAYADNIHQQAYPLAPQIGALLCFAIGIAPGTTRRVRWLIGCALCLALVALLTVELHLWLIIALIGYAALFGSAVRWRYLSLLALPLLLGIGLQSLQVSWGSPVPAEERPGLVDNLYRRSIGFAEAPDTPADDTGHDVTLGRYPRFVTARFGKFYHLPAWSLPFLVWFASAGSTRSGWRPSRWPPQTRLMLVLFVAGLGWMATMMQQTAVHHSSMRQLLPFCALLVGAVWTRCVRLIIAPRTRELGRVFAGGVGILVLLAHCTAAWSDVQMHRNWEYRHPLMFTMGWRESIDLSRLGTLPKGSVILTNHNRLPLIRYWSHRPTYYAPNTLGYKGTGIHRNRLELTINYLRGLYAEQLPPLIYVYRLMPATSETLHKTLQSDRLLVGLTVGATAQLPRAEEEHRVEQVLRGQLLSRCAVLARGDDWWAFDLAPIVPEFVAASRRYPIPRLKDMPPPR